MKKTWIKRTVALNVFLIALFVADFIINRGNTEITMDMPKATLPVVSVEVSDHKVNSMYGYTSKRQEAFTKGSITPIGEDRKISMIVDTFLADINSISYEVRSVDGERLIEGSEIAFTKINDEQIEFSIQLKDLIEKNTEYSFVTILGLEDGSKVYYYTRFIQNENYFEKEKLEFIKEFHEVTFSNTDGQEIKKYLESNSKGDNSTFHKVDIHSSLKQVMWDELSVEKVQEPIVLIKDITEQTASVVLQYLVQEKGSKDEDFYFVEEYYRVRYTPNRMYLLNYERTTDEIFDADKSSFNNDKVRLGITSEEISMKESEGGKILAFINADRLFVYNTVENTLSKVFSFYDKSNFDIRTRNRNYDIKILNIEDNGNLAFMVSGYMNRGIHEGKIGVTVYYYNDVQNVIEEQVFIPYEKSADILMEEIESFSYLNIDNHLFLILDGCLYNISLEEKSYEAVISGLSEDTYKVSDSGRMIAWMKDNDAHNSSTLLWYNLNEGNQIEIRAGFGEHILAMGFMGEDLVYGIAKKTDIQKDTAGNILFPAYKVLIKNQDGKLLKNYHKENSYVVDYEIMGNQITLKRVEKTAQDQFKEIADDHIASNDIQNDTINQISTVTEDVYKKVVQIILKNTVETFSLKIMTPKEVIFEGGREVALELGEEERYYVYGPYGIEEILSSSAKAVTKAYEISGSVVDEKGRYIWKKGTIYTKNQIMAIEGAKKDAQRSSLAVCLDTILQLEGISRLTQPLLDIGEDVFGILDSTLRQAKILDLTGCTLDTVLYYIDQDIPVLALLENGEAVLVVGFNEYNVVLMDPGTGTVYKKGMNDSRTMFEENGNQFISYVWTEES